MLTRTYQLHMLNIGFFLFKQKFVYFDYFLDDVNLCMQIQFYPLKNCSNVMSTFLKSSCICLPNIKMNINVGFNFFFINCTVLCFPNYLPFQKGRGPSFNKLTFPSSQDVLCQD